MNWLRTYWWNRAQLACSALGIISILTLSISDNGPLALALVLIAGVNFCVVGYTLFGCVSFAAYKNAMGHLNKPFGAASGRYIQKMVQKSYCDSRGALMALKDTVGRKRAYDIYTQFKPKRIVW